MTCALTCWDCLDCPEQFDAKTVKNVTCALGACAVSILKLYFRVKSLYLI